jgi:hypothetical protein
LQPAPSGRVVSLTDDPVLPPPALPTATGSNCTLRVNTTTRTVSSSRKDRRVRVRNCRRVEAEERSVPTSQDVIEKIEAAFAGNAFPGARFLQGSFEGCEPYDEVGPFEKREDWQGIEASFLDGHAGALSFFSEAGFRFFLPAYLISDLRGLLYTADPLFHLTHGFSDRTTELPAGDRTITVRHGRSAFINPRRYGAMTSHDYARYRLSVFTREEAGAIVAYLEFKRDADPDVIDKQAIDAALDSFWLERARTAPPAQGLRQHIAEQEEYLATIRPDFEDGTHRP